MCHNLSRLIYNNTPILESKNIDPHKYEFFHIFLIGKIPSVRTSENAVVQYATASAARTE
jgi:hypothetical protein